jgi:hypothetical protein
MNALHSLSQVVIALAILALASCGGDGRNRHKVYPVKGKILVNGQPANECQIVLLRTYDDKNPVVPQGLTNENGEFQLTSYDNNDGAPEGEYVATIRWNERSGLMKSEFDGPDRLGGAYSTPEKTKGIPGFVVKIERKSQELAPFDLKQSAEAKRKADVAKKQPTFTGPIGATK